MSASLRIEGDGHAPVSGLLTVADEAEALLVLGHGAGAPMTHPFMEALALALARDRVTVLRYNFSYMEEGRKRPDHRTRLLAVVRSALLEGRARAGSLPLFGGGKSMGGRMTSGLVAEADVGPIDGIVFFGFPLHAPGRKESHRGAHLHDVSCPMLFHQGTRDRLADLDLLGPLLESLGPRATLHVVDDADHSFKVPKRAGKSPDEIMAELADVTTAWIRGVAPRA